MGKVLMKGCEAIAEAAIRAGCRFFAGYPITPQNEIPEYFSRRMPEVGGVFVQGESEVASVNMVYGAAAGGTRSMTSSSSPGVSLKSEGISYCAAARLPMVYVNVCRGGPGVGVIQPAQDDYFQATKAAGNGGFRMRVFSPSTVQEAVDMTYRAFELADKDRNPVHIFTDGVIGTMMEPVELPEMISDEEIARIKESKKAISTIGHTPVKERVWIAPGIWDTTKWEQLKNEDAELYASWEKDAEYEAIGVEDADVIVTSYGVSGRIAKSAVQICRQEGIKVGLIRPKTIYPFPYKAYDLIDYGKCKGILSVEMAIPALFAEDVSAAVCGRTKISTYLRTGGNLVEREVIIDRIKKIAEGSEV